ncbi:MAG: TraR/DksA C4-type zinc finger protein [Pirellulales bacterium]
MQSKQSNKYRKLLEDLASRVGSDASGMVEQVRGTSGGNGGSELSNAPLHLGDMGTEEYLYDMNTTLLANEQYIVNEAREALRRIDAGSYGTCESCGKAIAAARLEAIPYTRYCVKCAETHDGTPQVNLDDGRPHGPKDTLAPEGEMQEDRITHPDANDFAAGRKRRGDSHAAGTAGGGTAVGGLAGSNEGAGEPVVSELDEATGSGNFDVDDDRPDENTPMSGFTGGAVGGTPARKRAK